VKKATRAIRAICAEFEASESFSGLFCVFKTESKENAGRTALKRQSARSAHKKAKTRAEKANSSERKKSALNLIKYPPENSAPFCSVSAFFLS